jgi:putative transposase
VFQGYQRYEGKYGYRQLQLFLWQDHGIWMNHKKVRLKRNFTVEKPNQRWVTDITQYPVGERWVYLWAIKDLFNNEIVAYEIGERNDNELVLRTFRKALVKQIDVTGLIVHSECLYKPWVLSSVAVVCQR